MIDFVELLKNTFNDECKKYIETPFRWDGNDYIRTLEKKLQGYQIIASKFFSVLKTLDEKNSYSKYSSKVLKICNSLIDCIKEYFKGLPQSAFGIFDRMIKENFDDNVNFFDISLFYLGDLSLYRTVIVDDNKKYGRDRCFHVPYNMREKVSTSRFSIPGHPTLYLSDNIRLSCEECGSGGFDKLISRFQVNYEKMKFGPDFRIVDLSLQLDELIKILSTFQTEDMKLKFIVGYLVRMPIQIACSFVRTKRNSSFAVEYVVPQILMQWIRANNNSTTIVGIRYKSCFNKLCSSLGDNYAFPTSGGVGEEKFCSLLVNGFLLTIPKNLSDYSSLEELEKELKELPVSKVL